MGMIGAIMIGNGQYMTQAASIEATKNITVTVGKKKTIQVNGKKLLLKHLVVPIKKLRWSVNLGA